MSGLAPPSDGHQGFSPAVEARLRRLLALERDRRRVVDTHVDLGVPVDPENPAGLPMDVVPIYDSVVWRTLAAEERRRLLLAVQTWQISQHRFMERAYQAVALTAAGELADPLLRDFAVESAASAVASAEACTRILQPCRSCFTPSSVMRAIAARGAAAAAGAERMLFVDVMMKSMSLAYLTHFRDLSATGASRRTAACMMESLSRQVAFARCALPEVLAREGAGAARRAELGRAAAELLVMMRDDVLLDPDVTEPFRVPADQAEEIYDASPMIGMYRALLLQRIAPVLRETGLLCARMRTLLRRWGADAYADVDFDLFAASDARIAREAERG